MRLILKQANGKSESGLAEHFDTRSGVAWIRIEHRNVHSRNACIDQGQCT